MPPKKSSGTSKKTEQKQKQKVFEDKTFGLKNKNKSAQVQKQIQSVKSVIMNAGQRKKVVDPNEEKKARRLEEQERIKELASIFKPVKAKETAATANNNNEEMGEEERAAALAALDEDESLSIEDLIEKERALIVDGTPVTQETFTMWKKLKKEQKERKEREREEQQIEKFKKSGSGITGRALFGYDATLFVDDADAVDKDAYIVTGDLTDLLGEVDDSLFADELSSSMSNLRVYDPENWTEDKTPKQQLFEYLTIQKIEVLPKFEKIEGDFYKIIFPHLENKELITTVPYTNKKNGEHGASLIGLDFLKNPQPTSAFGDMDNNEEEGDNENENEEEGEDENENENEEESENVEGEAN